MSNRFICLTAAVEQKSVKRERCEAQMLLALENLQYPTVVAAHLSATEFSRSVQNFHVPLPLPPAHVSVWTCLDSLAGSSAASSCHNATNARPRLTNHGL